MKKLFIFGALILVLLTAACGANQDANPTLVGTTLPGIPTNTPFGGFGTGTAEASTALESPTILATQSIATQAPTIVGTPAAGTSQTAVIPVTGLDIMPVDCQFCVDNMAHALLVLPDTATFEVASTTPSTTTTTTNNTTTTINTNCTTIEVNNGKQVVLCSGLEKTSITLNVCINSANGNTCTSFLLNLLACSPTQQAAPVVPNTAPTRTPRQPQATQQPTQYP